MSEPRRAGETERRGRWAKAVQFADAAAVFFDDTTATTDAADAYVTLAIHSGIASGDVICIAKLGVYAAHGAHDEEVRLLGKADRDAATNLARLLRIKTKAGYGHDVVSSSDVQTAARAHKKLLEKAEKYR